MTKENQNQYKDKNILSLNVPKNRREMFEKWIRLFNCKAKDGKTEYKSKYFITSRGTGKSKNTTLRLLFKVVTEDDFYASLLMRNWNEHVKMTRNYYEGVIDQFIDFFYDQEDGEKKKLDFGKKEAVVESSDGDEILNKKKKDKRSEGVIKEAKREEGRPYYRAVEYQDRERIFFFNLFHPSESKKADIPHTEIFYEEAIPTREQRAKDKKNKGWIPQEETNYSVIYNSVDRQMGQCKKFFLGNPTVPGLEIWFLLKHWSEELKEISAGYGKNHPGTDKLTIWRKGAGVKRAEKDIPNVGKSFLYLEKTEHKNEEFDSEDDWNGDLFFTRMADFKIIDKFVNGSEALGMYNDCIMYQQKSGAYFFAHKDDPDLSNKEDIPFIKEYYTDHQQGVDSRQKGSKESIPRDELLEQLKGLWESGSLFFKGMKVRDIIVEFITSQPVKNKPIGEWNKKNLT